MCRTPGWACPPGRPRARSSTARASAVAAPLDGCPVAWSHRAHGVRFISASASSAATSRSSGQDWYTSRMASAYPVFHGPQSAAGAADGYRAATARTSARSTGAALAARAAASWAALNARDTEEASSAWPNASQGLL